MRSLSSKALSLLRRCGHRRLIFVAFCAAAIIAALCYLDDGPHERDYGFSKSLPPAIVLLAALAIASPWMITRYRLPVLSAALAKKTESWSQRTGFWCGAAIAVIAASILWEQRLNSSLWTDEVTSMRENIVGRWKHRNNDVGHLKRPTIGETFFEYKTPNNHSLYSAVARVVHEKLVGINDTDFSRPYFNEAVLRLPALIAALAALPLIGYLALRLHSLIAAWLAMSWAVLHPWMLEFSTSARGYTFAMFFLTLAAVAAVRIFRCGGGWRWWALYGAGQFLAFFSVTTVAHFLILMNIAVFAGLLRDRTVAPAARRPHLLAFFTINLTAAAGAFVTFMPKREQFKDYLDSGHFFSTMEWEWMEDCMSNFFIGQPFLTWAENHQFAPATEQWPAVLIALAIVIALASLAMAMRRAWTGGTFMFLLALAMLLPPFTVYLQARAMEFYFFQWYSSWQLPLWIVLFSTGACAIIQKISPARWRWSPVAATAVLIAAIGIATHAERRAFLTIPVEQQRESAALMRPSPNPYAPGHEDIITTSLITANHAYDPWNRRIRNAAGLIEQMRYADKTNRPLYCDTALNGDIPFAEACEKIIKDENYFKRIGDPLPGLQIQNTRHVFKYIPGSYKGEAE